MAVSCYRYGWYTVVVMKYLGIDVGKERVGIAVSDDSGSVAFPLEQIGRDKCVGCILSLVIERNIDAVVLGGSVDLDGIDNPIMKEVHKIADAMRESVKVIFEPEQFSTQAAERLGKGSDAEAAAIILQSHLDRQNIDKKENIMFD